MRAVFDPLLRVRTYLRLVYLALAFPLGTAYFVFLVSGFAVGVGLLIVWVGLVILLGMVLASRALGVVERRLASWLLGVQIAPPVRSLREGSIWERGKTLLADPVTWKTFAWLIIRFPTGIVSFVILAVFAAATGASIGAPVALAAGSGPIRLAGLVIDRWYEALPLVPLGVVIAIVFAHVVNVLGWLQGLGATVLLGPSSRAREEGLHRRTRMLEERARLAHELHDAVGHTVTVMVVQATAAARVFDSDREFARSALAVIETSGRRALEELDRVLGVLRPREDGKGGAPVPELSELPDLVEGVREAGVPIELTVVGELDGVPAELGRSAYRIAQEALTNVLRHAGPVATSVTVRRSAEALELEVVNEGPPGGAGTGPAKAAGRGLAGIRERAAAFDGQVDVGTLDGGGFRIWVRLPLRSRSRSAGKAIR